MAKTPILILSFHEPDSCGGFNWALDTPDRREEWIAAAYKESIDTRDVILIACKLDIPDDAMPNDVTEMLDEELVFESGRVGEVLFRSDRWEDES